MDKKEIFKTHAELFQPDAEESKILRGEEPFISFEIIPAEKFISIGRQSKVSLLEYKIGARKERVLWKRMGAGKGLTKEEAESFHSRLEPYRGELMRCRWKIPQLFFTQAVECGNEFQIFSYEQFIPGGDGEKMVLNPDEPNFRKWFLVREVVKILSEYSGSDLKRAIIKNSEVTLLPHGLDLKLANVVLNPEGELYFVDLFGTKELDKKGNWLTYSKKLDSLPEENLVAICATREGAILRLYRLIEKRWAETGGISVEDLRYKFLELLKSGILPESEARLIASEIQNNFPWLDEVYSEREA